MLTINELFSEYFQALVRNNSEELQERAKNENEDWTLAQGLLLRTGDMIEATELGMAFATEALGTLWASFRITAFGRNVPVAPTDDQALGVIKTVVFGQKALLNKIMLIECLASSLPGAVRNRVFERAQFKVFAATADKVDGGAHET